MPVVSVQRVPPAPVAPSDAGQQFVDGLLTLPTLPATTTVYLDGDVYFYPGEYVLFSYGSLSGDVGAITLDITGLTSGFTDSAYLVHQPTQSRILVVVTGATTNGTQYVEGTLTIGGPTQIVLDADLYGGPGVYTLFSFGSLVGSVSDLVIVPPAGRFPDASISPNGCAVSGSTITLTLV
jgi:hypothetical protein